MNFTDKSAPLEQNFTSSTLINFLSEFDFGNKVDFRKNAKNATTDAAQKVMYFDFDISRVEWIHFKMSKVIGNFCLGGLPIHLFTPFNIDLMCHVESGFSNPASRCNRRMTLR